MVAPDDLRELDIQDLFPEGAVVAVATQHGWDDGPCSAEAIYVANAVDERRREFATGRACARRALARLGRGQEPIRMDADRLPVWPRGFVGSISHATNLCAAVVAEESRIFCVGLDVEDQEALREPLVARISSPEEREMLARLGGSAREWGTVLFSAKEAFYKCYYPVARTFLKFSDVRVELEPSTRRFRAELTQPRLPTLNGLRALTGRFICGRSHVACGIALELRRPPGLQ
jgi:4'-phosphopantetheinyl transferase EntD